MMVRMYSAVAAPVMPVKIGIILPVTSNALMAEHPYYPVMPVPAVTMAIMPSAPCGSVRAK